MLDGITVLDLASVGPAARASRWLADYGADVVKVGPVPKHGSVQIVPPFHSYGGHRGMQRILVDLKADDGSRRVPPSRGRCRRGDRELPARRRRVARHRLRRRRGGEPRDRVLLDERLRPGRPTRAVRGPRSQLPRGRRIPRDARTRAPTAGRRCPGATVADSAGGGMHAVIAILAALGTPRRDRYGRIPRRVGGRRRARADVARRRRVPRDRRRPGTATRTAHRSLRVLRQLRSGRRWLAVGRCDRATLLARTSAGSSAASSGSTHQMDDAVQDDDPRRSARRVQDRARATSGPTMLTPADTCVAPVLSVPEVVDDAQFAARGAFVDAEHPTAGTFRQVGPVLAGQARPTGPYELRDATETDVDDAARRCRVHGGRDRAAARRRSRSRDAISPTTCSS